MSDDLTKLLASTGEAFELIDCDPALADTAQFCEAYGYALEDSANTIIIVGKVEPKIFAACIVLATTRLDVNRVARKRLGVRKVSFASGEETEQLTGMKIGGVTPFGLPTDLPLWVDERVMERDKIILGGGSRDRKVFAAPQILTAIGGVIVDGLALDPA